MDQILESGAKTILLHKESLSGIDFSIIYNTLQKDPCNSEKEAVVYIYRQLRASEPPDEATARATSSRSCSSRTSVTTWATWAATASTRSWIWIPIRPFARLTREDIIAIIKYLIQLINSKADVDDIDHLVEPPRAHRGRTAVESVLGRFRAHGAYDPRAYERA